MSLNLTAGYGSLSSNIVVKGSWLSTRTIYPWRNCSCESWPQPFKTKDSVWERDLLIIRVSQNRRPRSSELLLWITALFQCSWYILEGGLVVRLYRITLREDNAVPPRGQNLRQPCSQYRDSSLASLLSSWTRNSDSVDTVYLLQRRCPERPCYQFIVLTISISSNLHHLCRPFQKRFACSHQRQKLC